MKIKTDKELDALLGDDDVTEEQSKALEGV